MTPLTRVLAASLLLSASTTSLAGSPAQVQLICAAGANDTLCAALASALGDAAGGKVVAVIPATTSTPASSQLRVEFIQERRTSDSLSGHLVWQAPDAAKGIGPTLEISIMDAALTDDALHRFATQLVQYSKLPL